MRALAAEVGLTAPRTLVATGNLVFEGCGPASRLEERLETAFEVRFGKRVDIVVWSGAGWRRLVAGNPFAEAAEAEAAPASVHVRVTRAPVTAEARLGRLRGREERLVVVEGDLWLHLPAGFARSRMAAAAGGARIGVGTFRNWNTVRRIGGMLEG